ncbi:MAG: family 10 glycosylhydrolase, partial [Pirellulales bacterium]|nr:family 10 glycosylhydrolase [Pirellulales bacterium]
ILPRSKVYEELGDQIAQCLAAAKKYGIEVHVWKVNYNLQHHAPRKFVEELHRQGRTQVSVHGRPKDWLCPSHPDNLKLEAESMVEVVRKYDVDGLHFDYIRYPDGNHCYCDGCRARFEAASGKKVANWPDDCHRGDRRKEYLEWLAEQITRLVTTVAKRAKAIRKDVKISAAVFGSYPSCRTSVGQDWVRWAKSGYVDFLCPMDYTASDMSFQALINNQLRLLDGCVPIYPGIGATATGISLTPAQVVGQVNHSRKLCTGGFTIFNLGGKTAESIVEGFGLGAGKRRAKLPHAHK